MAASRMGRPPLLNRNAIAHAVIDVGFINLTVAAVREHLGVGQTTLYRYAADRDELVRIGLSHLLENAAWPSRDGPWREVLSEHAFTLWHLWEAHPGAATEVARGVLPLTGFRIGDDLCAVLLRHGFTPTNAVLTCDIVFDMVIDNRHGIEHLGGSKLNTNVGNLFSGYYPNQVSSQAERATPEERRAIHAIYTEAFKSNPLNWFTKKLEVALNGVEQTLAPQS